MVNKQINEVVHEMVERGRHEADFGQLNNAKVFQRVLSAKNISSTVTKCLGHAMTVDTDPRVKLSHHFHVAPSNTPHRILGNFIKK